MWSVIFIYRLERGSITKQTERQRGVPSPSRVGHDPQASTPKRKTEPTGGSYNSQGRQAAQGSTPAPHLHDASALRPLARPGPAEDEDDDGLHEEKEAAALQQQDSGGGAAAVGRPKGGRGAAGPRQGCDRGCDCGTAAAALSPRRESASGSRAGRGGHMGAGLAAAALPGLTVPGPGWGRPRPA